MRSPTRWKINASTIPTTAITNVAPKERPLKEKRPCHPTDEHTCAYDIPEHRG
jgi:hypothetical protein